MDHIRDRVEVGEREAVLSFVGREEVRRVFADGFDELLEVLPHAIVCVVGGVAVAEGKCFSEGGFVFGEDGEGGVDGGSGCFCDDFVLQLRVLVADVLKKLSHLVRGEGLEESRES
jgi:hypothetical protein